MTSSSSPSLALERALDTMILVYSLLQGHPAVLPCEQFLRSHSGWFTSPLVLIEAKDILTKVYSVDASQGSPEEVFQKIRQALETHDRKENVG